MAIDEKLIHSETDLYNWLHADHDKFYEIGDPLEFFMMMHPRTCFLKNVPKNSVVLDVGAGDGGLINLKEWLQFPRPDLKFVGLDLEQGEFTGKYDEFKICDINKAKPIFEITPNVAVLSQFIEHIESPRDVFEWLYELLPVGGDVFVDWPASHTEFLPGRSSIQKMGFDITTLNFFDDRTHIKAYETAELAQMANGIGFTIINQGIIDMPFLANAMKQYGVKEKSFFYLSMAMWLRVNFVTYLTLKK